MTPYEPNPAKAISDCKGDINNLAMECEIAKSSLAFALIHIEKMLANPVNPIDSTMARHFLDAAKNKHLHIDYLAKKYERALSHIEALLDHLKREGIWLEGCKTPSDIKNAFDFLNAAKFKNGEVS
jgi:hypothetical protein